jgi:hypothetical protein
MAEPAIVAGCEGRVARALPWACWHGRSPLPVLDDPRAQPFLDEVYVAVLGDLNVDLRQELLELDRAVTAMQARDHPSVGVVNYMSFAVLYSATGLSPITAQRLAVSMAVPVTFIFNKLWSVQRDAAETGG